MSPISQTDDGNIELTKGGAAGISLLLVVATLLFNTGARWGSSEAAIAQERRDRMSADSAMHAELAPIARDIKVIKATLLKCTKEALCQ